MKRPNHVALKIRSFLYPDDYQVVYDIWENAGEGIHTGRSDTTEKIKIKLSRDPDLFLVAELDGQIVGTVLGGFDGRRGMVYHLTVESRYRNHGIGSALMYELEQRLKLKGCHRYYLLVTQDNEDAIKFYQNRGWQRLELFTFAKDID